MIYYVKHLNSRNVIINRMPQSVDATKDSDILEKAHRIVEALEEKKVQDIKAVDVRGLTLIADVFILCTATSEPQVKAAATAAREAARDAGHAVLRVEGDHHCGWVVVDISDIIVHVFRPQARAFYDLDRMWGDAPELSLCTYDD